ncbi:MAG: glutamate--tRNA ligase [bacterium]
MINHTQKIVKVRFAPSPTGYLHIGSARTAIFNYLFAKHHHGNFLIRIEDTDKVRSDPKLIAAILRNLEWLGLKWDDEPIYQSQRIDSHTHICEKLLKKHNAYYCFCDPEELKEKKDRALKKNGEYKYDRTCLQLSEKDIKEKLRKGESYAIRFYIPEGEIEFYDLVRGKIHIQNQQLDDFIIQRRDGTPVYQVAVVADDHDMEITHVIRGDDHISNTPKQILLYQALGWKVPEFAHIPLMLGPDKKRLSKRHGAVSLDEYQKEGYLPNALFNFLSLQGWSPKDNREILSEKELIHLFDLKDISGNAAVFNEEKLIWMNKQYISQMDINSLFKTVEDDLKGKLNVNESFIENKRSYILECLKLMQLRMEKTVEFSSKGIYFFKDPDEYKEKAIKKYLKKEGVKSRLKLLEDRLKECSDWSEETLEKLVRGLAAELDIGAGKIIHPLRVALTGCSASPGIFELMRVLGQDTVLRRVHTCVEYLE